MKIDGKVFVVTGAGSGVGRELTLELTSRGAKVAAVDIKESSLIETKNLAGIHVEIFPLDITHQFDVTELPKRVIEKFGVMDGLINNAGIIQPFLKIKDLKLEDIYHVMLVNFTGAMMMIKSFLPHLLIRPEARIVNVSSMGAYTPVPGQSAYGASKAAIASLTEGIASELKGTNVGVTLVFPGAMNTKIAANSGVEMEASESTSKIKMTDASVAAKKIVAAIEKGRERLYIGKDAVSMNLLSRLSPALAASLINRQMRHLLD